MGRVRSIIATSGCLILRGRLDTLGRAVLGRHSAPGHLSSSRMFRRAQARHRAKGSNWRLAVLQCFVWSVERRSSFCRRSFDLQSSFVAMVNAVISGSFPANDLESISLV